jgi:hypothetical protein
LAAHVDDVLRPKIDIEGLNSLDGVLVASDVYRIAPDIQTVGRGIADRMIPQRFSSPWPMKNLIAYFMSACRPQADMK